jgi:hypothetical protein
MPKAVISVLVYQIDGGKLPTPQTMGLPVEEITRRGVFPTREGTTWKRLEETVDESIYRIVRSGIQVKNGRRGYKTYYAIRSVADIIADINA